MTNDTFGPIHPGEILRKEYLLEYGLTAEDLADALHISSATIEGLICEKSRISADLALRLGEYFAPPPNYWLSLQSQYDVITTKRLLGEDLERISPLRLM
ncbi:MAG: HigA family addiction module antitoxin [Stappiaceae bacterium]